MSGISMEDAEAYFRWLAATAQVRGARPYDEQEWERAARGANARNFPHGDELLEDDANTERTYGSRDVALGPDEVGSHPLSESPFGLLDMAGNVYEMTRSVSAPSGTMMRGGAGMMDSMSARTTNRTMVQRRARDVLIGVRGCADAL